MKKLLLTLTLVHLLALLFYIPWAYALEWVSPTQDTIAWDAVVGDNVSYRVYVAPYGDYETKVFQADTQDVLFFVTLPERAGKYVVGISTVLDLGTPEEDESEINWSDVNGESTPVPFGYRLFGAPLNLRRQ